MDGSGQSRKPPRPMPNATTALSFLSTRLTVTRGLFGGAAAAMPSPAVPARGNTPGSKPGRSMYEAKREWGLPLEHVEATGPPLPR